MPIARLASLRITDLPLRSQNIGLYSVRQRDISHRNVDAENRRRLADVAAHRLGLLAGDRCIRRFLSRGRDRTAGWSRSRSVGPPGGGQDQSDTLAVA